MGELRLNEHHPDQEIVPSHNKNLIIGNTDVFAQTSAALPAELVYWGYRRRSEVRHTIVCLPSVTSSLTRRPKSQSARLRQIVHMKHPCTSLQFYRAHLRPLQLTLHPTDDKAFGNSASVAIFRSDTSLKRLNISAAVQSCRFTSSDSVISAPYKPDRILHETQSSPPPTSFLHSKRWSSTTGWPTNDFLSQGSGQGGRFRRQRLETAIGMTAS